MLECLLVVASLCSWPQTGVFNPRQVEMQIRRGDFEEASATLEDELTRNPSDFEAHLLLGIVRQEQGKPDEATREFETAKKLQPDNSASYINLAKVEHDEGKLTEASVNLQKAIRLDPHNANAHHDLGTIFLEQKDLTKAAPELEAAARLDPSNDEAWFGLFRCQLALGNLAKADEAARALIRSEPASHDMEGAVGALQAQTGDFVHAIPHLEKALAGKPDSSDAAYNLGLAWLRTDHADRSIAVLAPLRAKEDSAEVEDLLGEAYENQGQPVEAVRAYQRATQLDPRNEDATFDYLVELLAHKSFAPAVLVGRGAIETFPASVRMRLAYCGALYGSGDAANARSIPIQFSDRFPNTSLPLYLRSVIAESEKQPDEALLPAARKFVEGHPDDPVGWLVLGRSQSSSAPHEAATSLEKSISLDPRRADSEAELARVEADLEDWQQVVRHCKRALELDSDLTPTWYLLSRAYARLHMQSQAEEALRAFKARKPSPGKQDTVVTFIYTLK